MCFARSALRRARFAMDFLATLAVIRSSHGRTAAPRFRLLQRLRATIVASWTMSSAAIEQVTWLLASLSIARRWAANHFAIRSHLSSFDTIGTSHPMLVRPLFRGLHPLKCRDGLIWGVTLRQSGFPVSDEGEIGRFGTVFGGSTPPLRFSVPTADLAAVDTENGTPQHPFPTAPSGSACVPEPGPLHPHACGYPRRGCPSRPKGETKQVTGSASADR